MTAKKATIKKSAKKDALLIQFGERLKELREKRGLSGEELGELVGMPRQGISRLEVGGTNPSLLIISKLCKALKVKIGYFLKSF